jgi:cell division transport system permease protein
MLARIFRNSIKQIQRSGWAGWGSISVMTLAFLVAMIFSGIAFFSNLWIQYIESRSNLLVFFEVGMDPDVVNRLYEKWITDPRIKNIELTTEEEAFKLFSDYSEKTQPIIYLTLKNNEVTAGKLPSSLDIQIHSLNDLESIVSLLTADINTENNNLRIVDLVDNEKNPQSENPNTLPKFKYSTKEGEAPIQLKIDSESLDKLREVMLTLRIGGLSIMILLMLVIIFFTIMTVEFRLYNQMEEIGVMQLVGGSLFFIRAPYILEGGFYGLFGALNAVLMIGSVLYFIFIVPSQLAITQFFYENFSLLPWPNVSFEGWLLIIATILTTGFFVGSFSSWFAIRRYIR